MTALELAIRGHGHTAVVDLLEGLANGACVLWGVWTAVFRNGSVVIVRLRALSLFSPSLAAFFFSNLSYTSREILVVVYVKLRVFF